MQTLGVIALVLGVAFVIAGSVSYMLNGREPRSDHDARAKADETGCDLFTMNNEPPEAAIRPPEQQG